MFLIDYSKLYQFLKAFASKCYDLNYTERKFCYLPGVPDSNFGGKCEIQTNNKPNAVDN